ncbi:MAG: 30S ribosomal protein S8 [Candidatus Nealsonbacteria bacterium RBG_13_42_11]|uniref:Small ribosomal subunit protein uS8 n=1 Tax=Candidatus Nealsonbacteria bacterium RBG_13_42_11 TaxID=1801663 RepID=A0A1G2E0H1_9BACT|nr:MAG: 30S ribosomal protein S8 [Candidatus Nealsonbacteria bacterium RBG_13_42_11]
MLDIISDMLNRIKNGQAVEKTTVEIPFSNLNYEIAKILAKHDFIDGVEKKGRKVKKTIEITLKYKDKIPAISGLRRISKPGQKIYLGCREIKRVKGGYGLAIVSTPKGLMTDQEARKQKLGGEIICEVW